MISKKKKSFCRVFKALYQNVFKIKSVSLSSDCKKDKSFFGPICASCVELKPSSFPGGLCLHRKLSDKVLSCWSHQVWQSSECILCYYLSYIKCMKEDFKHVIPVKCLIDFKKCLFCHSQITETN